MSQGILESLPLLLTALVIHLLHFLLISPTNLFIIKHYCSSSDYHNYYELNLSLLVY